MIVMSKCPGQDTRYWKPEDIQDANCPGCGEPMEFWKTDIRVKCNNCQRVVSNPNFNLECAAWCSFATQCLGDVARGLGKPDSLRKKLEEEVAKDLPKDTAEIIAKALEKGWEIAERESAEFLITVLSITYKIIKDHIGKGEGERIFQNIRKRSEIPRLAAEQAMQVAEEVEKKVFNSSSSRVVYEALYGERIQVKEEKKERPETGGGRTKREIIKIDEDLCDGCGKCVPACAEAAIQIIDGKARLVSEIYCDGLGACLGECPQGAISMEEREAEPFDEEAVEKYLKTMKVVQGEGCPSAVSQEIPRKQGETDSPEDEGEEFSELANWPVKLKLVSPEAEFLNKPEIVISADCVPFAFGNFHRRFMKGRPLLIGCPKLDDTSLYYTKLTEIFRNNTYEKVTVLNMEIPCCSGLYGLVQRALEEADSQAELQVVSIGIGGEIKEG